MQRKKLKKITAVTDRHYGKNDMRELQRLKLNLCILIENFLYNFLFFIRKFS